jgi:hypothetical protein
MIAGTHQVAIHHFKVLSGLAVQAQAILYFFFWPGSLSRSFNSMLFPSPAVRT